MWPIWPLVIFTFKLSARHSLLMIFLQACGGEFLSSVDYYSYGLIASMSTTALFEVYQILTELSNNIGGIPNSSKIYF